MAQWHETWFLFGNNVCTSSLVHFNIDLGPQECAAFAGQRLAADLPLDAQAAFRAAPWADVHLEFMGRFFGASNAKGNVWQTYINLRIS